MMNLEGFSALCQARRSVYVNQFEPGQSIPESVVRQALENARWAPNHGQTEPWRFVVYGGHALSTLADALETAYRTQTPMGQLKPEKIEKLRDKPLNSAWAIALIQKRGTVAKIPEWEELAALSCAVQILALSLTSAGYGGYWSTPDVIEASYWRQLWQLQEHDHFRGIYYIGVPKPESELPPRATRRYGLADVVLRWET
jgi:nitroreductase